MKQNKYALGLDIGIASIGWACVALDENDDPTRIIDVGARIFKSLDNDKGKLYNETRREKRGLRRIISRRKERLRRIYSLCKKEGLYDDKKYIFQNNSGKTIYELKLEGFNRALTGHELTRCLIHYAKNRGFKSNRKNIEEDKDGSKIKESINKLLTIQEENECTITKAMMILKEQIGKDTFKNSTNEYIYFYDRASIEKEATLLLNKQIQLGVVSEKFREAYLDILLSQRDFSEGPGYKDYALNLSPYAVSFEQAFGKCKFTGEERISRGAPSYEIFVFLQKLIDFRYYKRGSRKDKFHLDSKQIQEIYNKFIKKPKSEYKYADLVKDIGLSMDEYDIVNLPQLTKKQYTKLLQDFSIKNEIEYKNFTDDHYNAFNKLLNSERLKLRFAKFPAFSLLFKSLETNDVEVLDAVGTILTFAKTDKKIDEYLSKLEYSVIPESLYEKMKSISVSNKEMKGSGNISLSLTRKLIPLFLKGKKYNEAMEELGYSHSSFNNSFTAFPTVKEIEKMYNTSLTSPNVRHVLVMLRKLYLAIESKYGRPTFVRIELSREMNKSYSERLTIEREQLNNRINRQSIKNKLATLCNLNDRNYFSNEDILRYELFEEQGGICMYTGTPIILSNLLSGEYEVDHIIPYSLSFDDSKLNKVLVLKAANQGKGNRVPLQWLKGEDKVNFEQRVRQSKLPNNKKDKLLVKEAVQSDDFTNRDFAITSYASKIVTRIFKDLLNDTDEDRKRKLVQTTYGGHTSALRYFYGLNKFTHSLITKDYNKQTCKDAFYRLESKNVSSNGISFVFINNFGEKLETSRTFMFKKNDKNNFVDQHEEAFFNIIQNKPYILEEILIELASYSNILNIKDSDIFKENMSDDEIIVREELNKLFISLREDLSKKDRNSHFHHMVDAVLIATLSEKMQYRINKHRLHTQILKERYHKEEIFDENGELVSLDRYIEMNKDEFKYINKKLVFIPPYPEFLDEMILRIFERDENILREKLSTLNNYQGVDLNTIKVRYPSHYYTKKASGSLHAETLYGIKDGVAVGRVTVDKLDSKKLEKLYDKDGGSKLIYETLNKWLKGGKKGIPLLPNGRKIKKVKLVDENIDKLLKISKTGKSQAYAGIGELARILVLTKEGEDNLYFAQIDNMRYLKYKKGDYDFDVVLWKAQGDKNSKLISLSKIEDFGFKFYQELIPGEIVGLCFQKERNPINGIVVGFASGKFEIGSVVGDNFDLDTKSISSRQQITVSTIKFIKKIQIDLLGNLIE